MSKSPVSHLSFDEPLIFEQSKEGRKGYSLPKLDVPEVKPESVFDKQILREKQPELPQVSEPQVVRHFTRLSSWNFSLDHGMYPLGSCTMKYNPKINEYVAGLGGFVKSHPYAPEELIQGSLKIIYELQQMLAEIGGFKMVSLQPSAGAQGEFTGISIINAYHKSKGNMRKKVLIPDTAHGTNPASTTLNGYEAVEIKSGPDGVIEPQEVAKYMDEEVAAIMVTNPNTLGLFEKNIKEIAEIVHAKGGLVYGDGANFNALMGKCKPGKIGIDCLQYNLHKTFSTPHGGGGPGSGPVGVVDKLEPFLPVPIVEKTENGTYFLNYNKPLSIGKVRSFYGNFTIMVRAYAYIKQMGAEGLRYSTEMAVLNASYISKALRDYYNLPYPQQSMHEVVFNDKIQNKENGISTLDIAKRLIDYGYHPPTIYFPLIVKGAIMVEPTENESKETIDEFIDTMKKISQEAKENPDIIHHAPHVTRVTRLDETLAGRKPVLKWNKNSEK